jgi:hypothetical protein
MSSFDRILRGMLGMGVVFSAVGGLFVAALGFYAVVIAGVDRDDLDFVVVATLGWFAISFILGMLYGGLLAILARGRSFKEVSMVRATSAGAAVGLVPALLMFVASLFTGGSLREIREPLMLFPPIGAALGAMTLFFARRAKPETLPEDEPVEAGSDR